MSRGRLLKPSAGGSAPMTRPESFEPPPPPPPRVPGRLYPEDIQERMFPHSAYEVRWDWRKIEAHVGEDVAMGLDIDPAFQRGHVWTVEQQRLYCEHVLCGGETARVLIFAQTGKRAWETDDRRKFKHYALVDGKQRLESCRALVRGDLRVFPRPEKPEGYTWEELSEGFKRFHVASFVFKLVVLETYDDILKLYLKLNAEGTPHTPEELDKVRAMLGQSEPVEAP